MKKILAMVGLAALVNLSSGCKDPEPIIVSPKYNTPELSELINTPGYHELDRNGDGEVDLRIRVETWRGGNIRKVHITDDSEYVRKIISDEVFDGVPDLVNVYTSNEEGALISTEIYSQGKLTFSKKNDYDPEKRINLETRFTRYEDGSEEETIETEKMDKNGNLLEHMAHVNGELVYSAKNKFDSEGRLIKTTTVEEGGCYDCDSGPTKIVETQRCDPDGNLITTKNIEY